jgi:type II restriction/modification system DNA methylase subunit YeeA
LEDRPRYTPSTTFETFPFPERLTPNRPAGEYADDPRAVAIAEAARRLNQLREAWLNPPDLVERVREVVPGFPDRVVPVSPKAALILKKRALTNLYNERPAWLDNAHRELDAAVAAAYGWPADIAEEEALARLLALNLERSGPQ